MESHDAHIGHIILPDDTVGDTMELKNAIALVTGGGEGIGRGIAEALKAEGSNVTITGQR